MATSYKRTDRVEFIYKGNTIYGTIKKGGAARCEVVADGGKSVFKVSAELLTISDKPLPKLPEHPMDIWGIEKYAVSKMNSRETDCFSADITLNGNVVIHAQNSGNGGSDRYYPKEGKYAITAQFEADAKQWFIDNGMPEENAFEASSAWIDWKVHAAPYGVSAEDYVADLRGVLNIDDDLPSMKM